MKAGFIYLSVIIIMYSCYIVGWHLSNELEKIISDLSPQNRVVVN
jgi:transposase InsO family protein